MIARGGEGPRALELCLKAIELLRREPRTRFWRPAEDATIAQAEAALGTTIPPSLRHFLRHVGRCEANGHEVLGLSGDGFDTNMGSNIVGATLKARPYGLPDSCIVVETEANGVEVVVDTADVTSCVRRWFKGPGWVEEETHASFGEYLLDVAHDGDKDEP